MKTEVIGCDSSLLFFINVKIFTLCLFKIKIKNYHEYSNVFALQHRGHQFDSVI